MSGSEASKPSRSLQSRLAEWKDVFPLIIAVIATATSVFVAYNITGRLNIETKRTEYFLHFTERYHNFLAAAHKLDDRVFKNRKEEPSKDHPDEIERREAHRLYFQLFGLVYDEFYAFQKSFLDPEALVNWMTWQMYFHKDRKYEIGGVPYEEGWNEWSSQPAVDTHKTTEFMRKMFERCGDRNCVRDLARDYGPAS